VVAYNQLKDTHLNKKKIQKYIAWAGGPSNVARELGLSRTTVWRWVHSGFPDTDFSGKTFHSGNIAKLCNDNGYTVVPKDVLSAGRP